MTREDGLKKLQRLAERLGIPARDIKVRPAERGGMSLAFRYRGVEVSRECASQEGRDRNFACLVLWMEDLVRNVERRIETVAEAFHAEGGHLLVGDGKPFAATQANLYQGAMKEAEAQERIARALERLDLTLDDVNVTWDYTQGSARIRMRLPSGGLVEKTSTSQPDARRNLAALALWLQSRAKNKERGLDLSLEDMFRANLLPAAGQTW
jgi:hypothetical protein